MKKYKTERKYKVMGFNIEEMAANMGIDAEAVRKAAASGDISGAMDSIAGALAGKGIDMNSIKEVMGKVDMNAVKEMAKDIDLKDMSPEKMKEMAEKLMPSDK